MKTKSLFPLRKRAPYMELQPLQLSNVIGLPNHRLPPKLLSAKYDTFHALTQKSLIQNPFPAELYRNPKKLEQSALGVLYSLKLTTFKDVYSCDTRH